NTAAAISKGVAETDDAAAIKIHGDLVGVKNQPDCVRIGADRRKIDLLQQRPSGPVRELEQAENSRAADRTFWVNPGGIMLAGDRKRAATEAPSKSAGGKLFWSGHCIPPPVFLKIGFAVAK